MTAFVSLDTLRTVAEVLAWWTGCALVACLVWIAQRRADRLEAGRDRAVRSRRALHVAAETIQRQRECEHIRDVLITGQTLAYRCLDCQRFEILGEAWHGASNKSRRSV